MSAHPELDERGPLVGWRRLAVTLVAWAAVAMAAGAVSVFELVSEDVIAPLRAVAGLWIVASVLVTLAVAVVARGLVARQTWAWRVAVGALWLLVIVGVVEVATRLPALHLPLLGILALAVLLSLPAAARRPHQLLHPASRQMAGVPIALAMLGLTLPLGSPLVSLVLSGWSEGPPLPVPLGRASAAIVDGYIHVVGEPAGGRTWPASSTFLQLLDIGDGNRVPEAGRGWAVETIDLSGQLAAGPDGPLYVLGSQELLVYQPPAPTDGGEVIKDTLTKLPVPWLAGYRTDAAVTAAADGRLLVIGGRGEVDNDFGVLTRVDVFDPRTGLWSEASPLSRPRADAAALTTRDGVTYVFGGVGSDGAPEESAEAYDPATGRWSMFGGPAAPRWSHTAAEGRDGRLYLFGGFEPAGDWGTPALDVAVYDRDSASWTKWIAPTDQGRPFAAAVGGPDGRIYLIGGGGGGDGDASRRVDVLAPPAD